MDKEFEYKGYKFNIKVELNTKVEKGINGRKWHTVTINCMGYDNYYKKAEIQDELLRNTVVAMEAQAIEYINVKGEVGKFEQEKLLEELGFK